MDNHLFIQACTIAESCFVLSGRASPISIRDQIMRAYVLARRLPLEYLTPTDGPVIVAGAGAAGVTFALEAAARVSRESRNQADIWLIESGPQVFSVQAGVGTRWIDFTQYDWPERGWRRTSVPGSMGPLELRAATAEDLAILWQMDMFDWAADNFGLGVLDQNTAPVRVLFNSTLKVQDLQRRQVSITGKFPKPPFQAGLLVDAQGAGQEKNCLRAKSLSDAEYCAPDHFCSERFWEEDDYEALRSDLHASGDDAPVLISGGSDGALQDFIRVVTGAGSARAVFEALPANARSLFSRRVRSLCDQENRAWTWGDDTGACRAARATENAMSKAISQAYSTSAISDVLDDILDMAGRHIKVCLVHPLEHFDNRYPLNRLLALLLLEHSDRQKYNLCRLPLAKLVDVNAEGGATCTHDPVDCRGHKHVVQLEHFPSEPATRCPPWRWGFPIRECVVASRVIIRHGLQPPPAWALSPPIRQLTPYNPPD